MSADIKGLVSEFIINGLGSDLADTLTAIHQELNDFRSGFGHRLRCLLRNENLLVPFCAMRIFLPMPFQIKGNLTKQFGWQVIGGHLEQCRRPIFLDIIGERFCLFRVVCREQADRIRIFRVVYNAHHLVDTALIYFDYSVHTKILLLSLAAQHLQAMWVIQTHDVPGNAIFLNVIDRNHVCGYIRTVLVVVPDTVRVRILRDNIRWEMHPHRILSCQKEILARTVFPDFLDAACDFSVVALNTIAAPRHDLLQGSENCFLILQSAGQWLQHLVFHSLLHRFSVICSSLLGRISVHSCDFIFHTIYRSFSMKKAAIRIRTAAFTQIVNLYEPFCKDPEFCSGNVIYRTFTILRNSQGASTKNLFQLLTHALLDAGNRRHIRDVAERNVIAVANGLSFII